MASNEASTDSVKAAPAGESKVPADGTGKDSLGEPHVVACGLLSQV